MIWEEIAHQMGLLPLAWLLGLALRGRRIDASLRWIAVALGLSWVADGAADHWPDAAWLFTFLYPATQASLVAAVLLLTRARKLLFAFALNCVATLAVLIEGTAGPDWILYPVAGIAVAFVAWPLWQVPVRGPLLVYFGLGAIAWLVHVRWLIAPTWYPFQACRAVGIAWFCWASMSTRPDLRLAR